MAAALIAVVLALVLGHAAPQLAAVRDFGWFRRWLGWLSGQLGDAASAPAAVLLSVGVPVAAMAVLQSAVDGAVYGLPGFLLALLVVFWCWGPRDLDLDVEAVLDAPDRERRDVAAAALLGAGASPGSSRPEPASLVEAVFRGGLERWFGVLLWFLLLGPAGALLYRLAQQAALPDAPLQGGHAAAAARLKQILDWPVAQLMTLSLALVANFDVVLAAWRDWHAQRGDHWWSLDSGFLGAVARASVECELVEDEAFGSAEEPMAPADAPLPALLELRDAMSLVWRMLLLWLTVLALAVLAGFVG